MTNRQFIILACRTMSVLTLARLPWFVMENVQSLYRIASWPGTKSSVMSELTAQTTPIMIVVFIFELIAAFILWRFAEVIATTLGGYKADEAMARVATLSLVDVQSLIFVGIGMWMMWSALSSVTLTIWQIIGSYFPIFGVPMFAGLAPSLWMSAAYQFIHILGGVALIFFARPLARFTQREKKETS